MFRKFATLLVFITGVTITTASAMANNVDGNIQCMAHNIYFETLGSDIDAKRAVAQTTMNRVNHSRFPNTVCSVVYQKGQYSWTRIRGRSIRNHKEYRTALDIAREAVSGKVVHAEAHRKNALFFHARRINPGWNNLSRVMVDTQHVFYTYRRKR